LIVAATETKVQPVNLRIRNPIGMEVIWQIAGGHQTGRNSGFHLSLAMVFQVTGKPTASPKLNYTLLFRNNYSINIPSIELRGLHDTLLMRTLSPWDSNYGHHLI